MDIQAKIYVTKDSVYVYGDITQKPIKLENKSMEESYLIGEAYRKFERLNALNQGENHN
ncbi:hypothetical protein [Bacillus massiliglaciei]|uniref:hypothetical protein n=1 Tax=Bacillus massiliglaciei TaxID=1816693 RepID=UPI0018FE214B|nr:hypothetical protein [Bacillus massiliglaciei]